MIENPDKFQAIVIDKRKSNNTDVKFFIDQEEIQAVSSAAILDITIDDKLNFNWHIDFCLKSANQINSLARIKFFLENEERKILINSCVLLNVNYCPQVWMLANAKSVHKIEDIQKRALSFTLNDYETTKIC